MSIAFGENFLPFQRHIKIVEMDGAAIYYTEAEIGLLPLKNWSRISGVTYISNLLLLVTYTLCLKPYTGLGLPSGTIQRQLKFEIVAKL